jgi:hypothetical protein
MNWFKSVWLRMRKSNGLPGNEVLVPMAQQSVEEKPKRKYTRKKKDVNNS